jgi:hypothetical protein
MAQRKATRKADPVQQLTSLVLQLREDIDHMRTGAGAGWVPPVAPAPVERAAPMQTIVLRVPAEIIEALDKRGSNRSDVARAILAAGLGLAVPEPSDPKGPRSHPRRQR